MSLLGNTKKYQKLKIKVKYKNLLNIFMDMRIEIENWLKQAKQDLFSAEKNFEIKLYYLTAFLTQQSIEKGLKALTMFSNRERIVTSHSLIELGKKVKAPEEIFKDLRKLAPEYIISRYPDATNSIPYENYDEEIAKDLLKRAKKVFLWIENQMKE